MQVHETRPYRWFDLFHLVEYSSNQAIMKANVKVEPLDKTTGNICPRCGLQTLNIYYEDETDLQLGARCEECGLKGFFMNGKLVQIVEA